eukprot:TRINITY_DN10287_c0_g1_i2.p1 TRINITY_DN10287_c0_g1~~TRINITY_DN10287_c0_g1_i2.p1  ORF type:complete len:245 (-),score=50.14 TRINITY_DN10287_c0_g1_i2:157-891(-)
MSSSLSARLFRGLGLALLVSYEFAAAERPASELQLGLGNKHASLAPSGDKEPAPSEAEHATHDASPTTESEHATHDASPTTESEHGTHDVSPTIAEQEGGHISDAHTPNLEYTEFKKSNEAYLGVIKELQVVSKKLPAQADKVLHESNQFADMITKSSESTQQFREAVRKLGEEVKREHTEKLENVLKTIAHDEGSGNTEHGEAANKVGAPEHTSDVEHAHDEGSGKKDNGEAENTVGAPLEQQ